MASAVATRPVVLVHYEACAAGRAALARAIALACEQAAELVVVSVASRERSDVGCGICRHGAVIWNQEMQTVAGETLAEAAALIGDRVHARFLIAIGERLDGLAAIAGREGAGVIVLPRAWRPRWLPGRRWTAAERLRTRGPWQVEMAL